MEQIVYKFGGTSLADADRIKRALGLIAKEIRKGRQVLTVVSALGGVTNEILNLCIEAVQGNRHYISRYEQLIERHRNILTQVMDGDSLAETMKLLQHIAEELRNKLDGLFLLGELTPAAKDLILSCGERFSAVIIHAALRNRDIEAVHSDTRDLIVTDSCFGSAGVLFPETNARIRSRVRGSEAVWVFTGFIAANTDGRTTTLGRSGSDYTASIIAAALKVEKIVIWTDVDGVLTADPRICPDAFTLPQIGYEDAMELSHFGAKVIFPPTMIPAMKAGIPIQIRNSFRPANPGTVIAAKANNIPYLATGIASIENISLLRIQGSGMVGQRGILARLFECLAQHSINIILITQASSEHSICIAIDADKTNTALQVLRQNYQLEIEAGLIDEIMPERDAAILAVVGEKMRHTPGIAAAVFSALGNKGINVKAISQGSSERNISIVIARKDEKKAVQFLHDALFKKKTEYSLYLIGTGNVGAAFAQLLGPLFLRGICNSRKMYFNADGIDSHIAPQILESEGKKADLDSFIAAMQADPSAMKICVDCSASREVADRYADILNRGISVVTANKIANASSMEYYKTLQDICRNKGVHYRYETTVGAALPVISTLRSLMHSGDTVHKIEAVVSGTLSYVFNTLNSGTLFSDIVRSARELGYTEPDPRLDLIGTDVLRKALILAREINYECEPEEVKLPRLISRKAEEAENADEFMEALKGEDTLWREKVIKAEKAGKKIRYMLLIENGKISIELKPVEASHPFYQLSGTDNIIAIYSRRYAENPLVIRGAGAGGELTASGVLTDVRALMGKD
jgi:bifunctional aspartokinase / homoserine dehydrogenase 1